MAEIMSLEGFLFRDRSAHERIDALNERTNDIEDGLDAIYAPRPNKYIFIGDSYGAINGDVSNGWAMKLRNHYGLNNTYFNVYGGTGFKAVNELGQNWKSLLEAVVAGLSEQERKEITHIVVAGGYNDTFHDVEEVALSFGEFVSYVRSNLPYAKIMFANIAFSQDSVMRINIRNFSIYWREWCANNGVECFHNAGLCLHNYDMCFLDDGFHPNEYGQAQIYETLRRFIDSNDKSISLPAITANGCTLWIESGVLMGQIYPDAASVLPIETWPANTPVSIPINHPYIRGGGVNAYTYSMPVGVWTPADNTVNFHAQAMINEGSLVLTHRELNETGTDNRTFDNVSAFIISSVNILHDAYFI